ncbi:putative RING-H2 finger protein ATL21A [Bienertia sinuspersici]
MNQYPIIFCLLTLLYVIFLPHLKAVELCPSFYCNDQKHDRDPIHFPFRVPENQTTRCGYPGFDLSCNSNNQTLLSSLSSEPLIVEGISYSDQLIWLSDPNHCTPKRVMDLSLTSTPFSFGRFGSAYTIVNCSQPAGSNPELPRGSSVITCMSEGNYTVIATFKKMAERELVRERGCEVMNKINAAFWWRDMEEYDYFYPTDLSDVLVQLNWGVPSCGRCDLRGGSCGFVGGMGLEVGCVIPESSGKCLLLLKKFTLLNFVYCLRFFNRLRLESGVHGEKL